MIQRDKTIIFPIILIGIFLTIGSVIFYQTPSLIIKKPVHLVPVATTTVVTVPEKTAERGTTVVLAPKTVIQGEPMMITILGTTTPTKMLFNGTPLIPFMFHNQIIAFAGIDLNQKPATYALMTTFPDGEFVSTPVTIVARNKIEAPLGIPEKLGGNTTASQKKLVETLAAENATLVHLKTASTTLWSENFQYPVANPIVTDDYGYTRQTGAYSIAHKGTDFRAAEGTPVMAMNSGVVRVVREYTEYGKTVIIDHGLGLMTFYMHLSKINVKAGQEVSKGEVIGLSGQTGYADMPHLHLTVRINDVSIDPIVFLKLFE